MRRSKDEDQKLIKEKPKTQNKEERKMIKMLALRRGWRVATTTISAQHCTLLTNGPTNGFTATTNELNNSVKHRNKTQHKDVPSSFFSTSFRPSFAAQKTPEQPTEQPQSFQMSDSKTGDGERVKEEKKEGEKVETLTHHQQQSKRGKVKEMLKKYGPIGVVTHITLSLISLGTWYTMVRSGIVDPRAFLKLFDVQLGDWIEGDATTFALAYVCHKSTAIVRYPISLTVTPFVAERFERFRLGLKAKNSSS